MRKTLVDLGCSAILILGLAGECDAGLVGYWPLDEGAGGQALDSTGKGHNGTINGATWVTPGWNGEGACLQFDGVDDRVEVPHATDLRFAANTKYTLAAWVNWTVRPGHWSGIVTKGREVGNWYGIWLDPSNAWVFGHGGNNQVGSVTTANVWIHVAMVYDNGNKKIYLNGKLDNETNSSQNGDNTGDLWFGAAKGVTEFAPAKIDDIRIYDQALTAQEIKALVPPKLKASDPNPANGAVSVSTPLLQWTKGETAVFHNVYLGTTPDLSDANLVSKNQSFAMYYAVAGLEPGATYYWRVDEVEADMTTVRRGDVWTFLAQDVKAYYPMPTDQSPDVAPTGTLTWQAGQAAIKHHLYFGTSRDDVTNGTAATDKGELTEAAYTPTGLDSLTTYYWRVDELVPGGTVKTGPVWSFTTYLPVDDFESYTDQPGEEIFSTWTDGYTDGTNGSTVGYMTATNGTFGETTIVHSGQQSMPMDYNNINTPFYSEAYREFAPVQNWTADELSDLRLDFRGASTNGADALYVAVEDSAGKVAVITNSDPAAVKAMTWTEWKIPLSSLTGINLAKVKKLYIGVGDKANPVADGAGRIYIDDIRVTRP